MSIFLAKNVFCASLFFELFKGLWKSLSAVLPFNWMESSAQYHGYPLYRRLQIFRSTSMLNYRFVKSLHIYLEYYILLQAKTIRMSSCYGRFYTNNGSEINSCDRVLNVGGGCFKIKIVNFKRLCFISMVHSAGLCYILCYTLFIYFVIQFVKTVNSLENKASTSFLWPVVATLNLLESVSFPLTIFKSVRCPFCFHFVL